jgi:hypothetical protein
MRMGIEEVNGQTEVSVTHYRQFGVKRVAVHAVMPCGVDGPWIGELMLSQDQDPDRGEDEAKVWTVFAVRKSNQYRLSAEPASQVRGKMNAALALRDYVAGRNA